MVSVNEKAELKKIRLHATAEDENKNAGAKHIW
jgi:hypothetical protein